MRISIIIATFNAAKTLRDALESVRHQTFQDWECIVVDGKSTDETVEIVKEFIEIDSRYRYISEPDRGIYDAFNKGWKMAKGEWIYYLGADDILQKESISRIFENGKQLSSDIIYGNVIFKTKEKYLHKKSNTNVSHLKKHMVCSHQAVFMKKNILQDLNGFDLRYHVSADFDLMLRCYLKNKKFQYINVDVAIFNSTGVSNGIGASKDAYLLRKNNHSISKVENLYIYTVSIVRFILKRMIRKVI